MRAQGKGNAACWECRFHCLVPAEHYTLTLTVQTACSVSGTPVVIDKMPMKCEKKKKAK